MPQHDSIDPAIGATVLGYPRIGRDRELKQALEAYWAARSTDTDDVRNHADRLEAVATQVRLNGLETMRAAGLRTIPVNTFSLYDQVLDTALMVGAVPERFRGVTGGDQVCGFDADLYFAMARGDDRLAPLEMTKWFDTNYHYLVPEIDPTTPFVLDPRKVLSEHAEAAALGLSARPVLLGPWTFLRLAKAADRTDDGFVPMDRLEELTELYADLLARLAGAGVDWVQLDEPAAVQELSSDEVAELEGVYRRLAETAHRPAILVATYFGSPAEALPALGRTAVEGLALDLVRGPTLEEVSGTPGLKDKTLVLGAVDGRNVWRNDLSVTLLTLQEWRGTAADLAVSTSCSLMHVPYDVWRESSMDLRLRRFLAFADQKLDEVVALQQCLDGRADHALEALRASDHAAAEHQQIPGLRRHEVGSRLEGIGEADRRREPQAERDAAQRARLALPPLPTTTIGSFPQTDEVRRARAAFRAGRLDENLYVEHMRTEIRAVIALQERLGLDVLVHGEPERNDMVQYFAEQLDGFVTTKHGWVQSYGSRCVRPPILYGDVARPEPMTVSWSTYAQGLTDRPVKAMLTGPVTILAWSFVRDDQPRSVTADQVGLALRDEVADLEAAGLRIIQVDEPALRELLPLRVSEQKDYLAWAVGAFRLATSGVDVATQVHTHLCYSEFGEVIEAIDQLGADVTSVEAARSNMELLLDVAEHGFTGGLGPGVYDIHSPRVPSDTEVQYLLTKALRSLSPERLWVNPDCGLKTRAYPEVEPTLSNMVQAALTVRESCAPLS